MDQVDWKRPVLEPQLAEEAVAAEVGHAGDRLNTSTTVNTSRAAPLGGEHQAPNQVLHG